MTPASPHSPPAGLGSIVGGWFSASFGEATPVQRAGWPTIAAGKHALLIAPTGSGKTLAGFLAGIDRLTRLPEDAPPGVRILYVSPLKALVYDIERNLRQPLEGIRRGAEEAGEVLRVPRVAIRTGDTTQAERRNQARDPAEILVTTPESLYLILGSQQREMLRSVETVLVDEIHTLAATKRGAHLALSLERLAAATDGDPQRVGLSATARPLGEVARYLGGDRPVEIVDRSLRPDLDLEVCVPVPDMTRPGEGHGPVAGDSVSAVAPPGVGLWPAILPRLLDDVRSHTSTIVFVNSRGLCERLAQQLNELAEEDLVRAHHGSLAHAERQVIEAKLKSGALRGIVATSSLELGIDMDAVDLVLLVESPGAVARGLQRVGRAGHQVGRTSRGVLYPKHRSDLLEATVVAHGMRGGEVEPVRLPLNPLDVLAQHIVSHCAVEAISLDTLERIVRRTAHYRMLSREVLCSVLDMLAGRYPSADFSELRPRIVWDRDTDTLETRKGARPLALMSGGTIPDRGLYRVHLGVDGPRIGELDEEMVHETRPGEALTLGASTWRVEEITRDRVVVSPAPGAVGKLPFWHGDGPGRPVELGRAMGRFVRELGGVCGGDVSRGAGRAAGEAWLAEKFGLDTYAARNLVDYVVQQKDATGVLPTDAAITIERFRDELGDWRLCILSPFGARLHAPWALAIESSLSQIAGFGVETIWSDDGIVLRLADAEELPPESLLLPDADEVEDLVVTQLGQSSLFAGQFRENATRALLLPRRRPGLRTPLFVQRLRAQNLLAVAQQFPSFPILLETYRSCLQDIFDLPGLVALLQKVRSGEVRVDSVETRQASPFARSLVFAYTAAYLYQGDTPVAERRAQALTLDRSMLRDLLGDEDLRGLLDTGVIEVVESELQARGPSLRAGSADALHDLLRRLGDLSRHEIRERCEGPWEEWLAALGHGKRIVSLEIADEERFIAAEDAGLARDALGIELPAGLPMVFLDTRQDALDEWIRRYARGRGPFVTDVLAHRYALDSGVIASALARCVVSGALQSGEMHPEGTTLEWCDVEVLRRIRRRTLRKLRAEVAPVATTAFNEFLIKWHGIGEAGYGPVDARLDLALARLEGIPLVFSELERLILRARVEGLEAEDLDALGALGQWVWVGCGSHGERDLRLALYRRDKVALLHTMDDDPGPLDALEERVLGHLTRAGACFVPDLVRGASAASESDVLVALWSLATKGLVTNDTFAALRGLMNRKRRAPARRGRRPRSRPMSVGRWSTVANLLDDGLDPTRRAHARAVMLLERYGVVSRDVVVNERMPGGFSAVYAVYRQMEESGKLRRGHFVEALTGAQFAFAGVVDRLRGDRAAGGQSVAVLAATDPANPYGAVVAWPPARAPHARPRRLAGASVISVDGALVLYVDKSGQRAISFPGAPGVDEYDRMARAAQGLRRLFVDRRRHSLRIERLDDSRVTTGPYAEAFVQAGFRPDHKGFVLDRNDALRER